MFANRKLVIATKHKKEIVISPLIQAELKAKCFVPIGFNTDLLGTFSGEIERQQNALATVRTKCLLAMDYADCDLGIASEGSFGAHPTVFFAAANEEILILIDKRNKLEIVVRELSLATNFDGKIIKSEADLVNFAAKSQFPSHGLILKNAEEQFTEVKKDIQNEAELLDSYHYFLEKYGSCYIETDMRAMNNPSRMKVIEKATLQLIEKVKSYCPECQTPGFVINKVIAGLRCELCNMPTKSTLVHVYECEKCHFTLDKKHPNNKTYEDPAYCDFCNP
jgi:hypothetical protein